MGLQTVEHQGVNFGIVQVCEVDTVRVGGGDYIGLGGFFGIIVVTVDHAADEIVVLAADEDDGVVDIGTELDVEGPEEGVGERAWVEARGWRGGCVVLGVECCLSGSILIAVDRRI